jgi:3-methyl-2-oxobutanoate hydroxymethyltransferase
MKTRGIASSNGAKSPPEPKSVTVPDFLAAKKRGEKLALVTAYDFTTARLVDAAGVDCILVGDSLGMVIQGEPHCLTVTLEQMIYHTRCVARGVQRALLATDLPFMSYQVSRRQALESAGRLVKEGGAHAVKLEGGERSARAIAAITNADIPVIGHIGLTPQSIRQMGGFRVQRDEERLLRDAKAVEHSGAFAIVLECVPAKLAAKLTASLKIPTIGIGAGAQCDGQILVLQDLLGMYDKLKPRFVKAYAEMGRAMQGAVESYCRDVREARFPAKEHEFE